MCMYVCMYVRILHGSKKKQTFQVQIEENKRKL